MYLTVVVLCILTGTCVCVTAKQYEVNVYTGDVSGGGTDANVYLTAVVLCILTGTCVCCSQAVRGECVHGGRVWRGY